MCGGEDALAPKSNMELSLKEESTCNVKDVTVFAFYTSILLGCIDTRGLVLDAMLSEVGG